MACPEEEGSKTMRQYVMAYKTASVFHQQKPVQQVAYCPFAMPAKEKGAIKAGTVISCSNNGTLNFWKHDQGDDSLVAIKEFFGGRVLVFAVLHTLRKLVCSMVDATGAEASMVVYSLDEDSFLEEEYRQALPEHMTQIIALENPEGEFRNSVVCIINEAVLVYSVSPAGRCIGQRTFKAHELKCTVAIRGNAPNSIITADVGGQVNFWDLEQDPPQLTSNFGPHSRAVTSMTLLRSGIMVVGCIDGTVSLFESATTNFLNGVVPDANPVLCVAGCKEADVVAVSTIQGLYIWDIAHDTLESVQIPDPRVSASIATDPESGCMFVSSFKGGVMLLK